MRPSRAETPISTFKSIHSDSGGGCSSYVKSFNHLSCQMFENLTQVGGCVEEWFVLKESLCAVGRSGSGCLRTHRLPRSLLKIQMVGPHLELLPTGCCVEPQETDCRPGVPWRCPLLQRPPSRTTGHLPRDCMSHSHMKTTKPTARLLPLNALTSTPGAELCWGGLKGASSRHCLPTQEDLSLSWKDPKPNSMLRRIVGKHTTWSVNKAEAGREPIRDDIATTSAAVTTSAATVSAALTNIGDASDNGDGRLTSEHFPCASASYLPCMLLGICECGTMTS